MTLEQTFERIFACLLEDGWVKTREDALGVVFAFKNPRYPELIFGRPAATPGRYLFALCPLDYRHLLYLKLEEKLSELENKLDALQHDKDVDEWRIKMESRLLPA